MTVAGVCASCIYWDRMGDTQRGRCRFNAPPLVQKENQYPGTYWVITDDQDWCGQYESTQPAVLMPVVSGVAAAPAGTTSATEVMMGLGSIPGFSITPNRTGRVAAMITGTCSTTGTNGGINISGRHGTGPAPANGDLPSGTFWSTTQHYFMTSARDVAGFTVIGGNPNLALGMPVWFDVSIAATSGGTVSITDVQSLLFEL